MTENPSIVALQAQIASIQAQIANMNAIISTPGANPHYVENGQQQIGSWQQDINTINQQIVALTSAGNNDAAAQAAAAAAAAAIAAQQQADAAGAAAAAAAAALAQQQAVQNAAQQAAVNAAIAATQAALAQQQQQAAATAQAAVLAAQQALANATTQAQQQAAAQALAQAQAQQQAQAQAIAAQQAAQAAAATAQASGDVAAISAANYAQQQAAIQAQNVFKPGAVVVSPSSGGQQSPGAVYQGQATILGGTWGNTPATLAQQQFAGGQIQYTVQNQDGSTRPATQQEAKVLTQQAVAQLNPEQQVVYATTLAQLKVAPGATPQEKLASLQNVNAKAAQDNVGVNVPVNIAVQQQIAESLGSAKPVQTGKTGDAINAEIQAQAINAAQKEAGLAVTDFKEGSSTTAKEAVPTVKTGTSAAAPSPAKGGGQVDISGDGLPVSQGGIAYKQLGPGGYYSKDGTPLVKLSNGEFAGMDEWNNMTVTDRKLLYTNGFTEFNKIVAARPVDTTTVAKSSEINTALYKWGKDNQSRDVLVPNITQVKGIDYVLTPDNLIIPKASFDQMDARYQEIILSGGMSAYNKAIDAEYVTIPEPNGKPSSLLSNSYFYSLPGAQQYVLLHEGSEALVFLFRKV